ncbi:hypothetical protein [Streptomyces sp. V2I9]|uniref:hypothetical protein n=1 Tax=Streptomyces sp. V2I9 TaxID=3042304 RepID=UPI0027872404|nr:hypothetical protein [Streptomyces sp. V2I9]MDQ0987063.1 hypothetical protein [Streptomyces sp. V2I9]
MPPEKQGAEAPDPAKTAMTALLQDLLDLQEVLERQKRRSRQETREPVRPEPPDQGQGHGQGQEDAAPGRRDASTSTDTEKLIAYLIQKLLERLTPPGQQSAQQQAPAQQQPWGQQSPGSAPDRFDQPSRDGRQGTARSVAEAVETILSDHPELVEMFHDGQLPRTKQLFDEAHRAASAQGAIAQAAALSLPAQGPETSAVNEDELVEEDELLFLDVDHRDDPPRKKASTDESVEDEVYHDARDDLETTVEDEVYHDARDDLETTVEDEVYHDAREEPEATVENDAGQYRTSISSLAALPVPGIESRNLTDTPTNTATSGLPVMTTSDQLHGRNR